MKKMADSIEDEYKFQQVEWPVYRIGWVIMALFLLAGLFGIFGTGIISRKSKQGTQMAIDYDRYLRYSVKTTVHIKLKHRLSDSTLAINASYIKAMKVDKIVPEPSSMILNDNKLIYKFASSSIQQVSFFIEPIRPGSQYLEIYVGGIKNTINQFVFF